MASIDPQSLPIPLSFLPALPPYHPPLSADGHSICREVSVVIVRWWTRSDKQTTAAPISDKEGWDENYDAI